MSPGRYSIYVSSLAEKKWMTVDVQNANEVLVHTGSAFKRGLGFTSVYRSTCRASRRSR